MERLVGVETVPCILDVSFLAQPDVSRPIIYRYRDGLLLSRVRKKIQELLDRDGGGFRATTPNTLIQTVKHAGLFDDYVPYFEWPKNRSRALASLATGVLEELREGDSQKVVLFAPENSNLFDSAEWLQATEHCLVIEEAVTSAASLPEIMKYYWSMTDLPYCPLDRGLVQLQLLSLEFDKRYPRLGQFISAVDRAMLLHYEAEGGTLSASCLTNKDAVERSNILRPLRRLLENEPEAIEDLVYAVEIKLRRQLLAADEIAVQMFELARDLLREDGGGDEPSHAAEDDRLRKVLWAVTCLVGLPHLLRTAEAMHELVADPPETFLAQFDLLCRDFQRRLSCDSRNPFADWWSAVESILIRFEQGCDMPWPSSEERLLSALSESLAGLQGKTDKAPWVRRLATIVRRATAVRYRRQIALESLA